MKVAIDSGPLTGGDAIRGIGVHTREVVAQLKKIKNLEIDLVDFKVAALSKYDIVHYQYFHPHFLTLPLIKPAKKVILTIHDLIRLIYPSAYPPGIKGSLKFLLQKFNLRNIDAVITISETSKKDIVRFLNIPPEKIHVIYLAPQTKQKNIAVSTSTTKAKYNLPNKFVLYVGDVNYNKNILRLADACKIAKLPLVIVGKQAVSEEVNNNVENQEWRQFLRKYKNDKNVLRLGFLDDSDFEAVFHLASIYCQPSLYEGFGLPLLEAFERDVPIVAAKTQALVEVGGDACIYVDPKDPADMAHGILKVIKDKKLASGLIKKGAKRLENFSWSKTAQQTYEVYEEIYSQKL